MQHYTDIKTQYNDCIVLICIGEFYETFLNDAKIVSEILGTVLVNRNTPNPTEITGFRYGSLDTYLPKLIKAGHKVAIVDYLKN